MTHSLRLVGYAIIAVAAVSGCTAKAETPDLAVIKAQEDAATKLYLACIAKEAKRLDDRTSDPASIAPGIISACGAQFEAAENTFSRYSGGDYLQTRRQIQTALRQSGSDFAIRMILENRAEARKHPARTSAEPGPAKPSKRQPTGEPYMDAGDAFFRGDYQTTMRLMAPMAEKGQAPAQAILGAVYFIKKNYAEAAKWYRRAADQGYPEAQHTLGQMYLAGLGVPQSYVQAYVWFAIAVADAANSPYFDTETRGSAVHDRDLLAPKMTTEQVDQARQIAGEWKPKPEQ